MNGIFIPDEFFELNLTHTEIMVLSFYKYYTEKGKMKCCKQPNESIYTKLHISEKTFKKVKKHLKELGYIRTDGGIRVYYLGVENKITESDTEEQITEEVVEPVIDEVEEPTETDIESVEEQVNEPVNKTEITENEEVDETDNKTDIVMEKSKSNVEKVIESLNPFYQDPEKLKYFYEKCKLWVEKLDNLNPDEFNYSVAVTGIKSVINKKFGYPEVEAIPNTNKKEVKSEVEVVLCN